MSARTLSGAGLSLCAVIAVLLQRVAVVWTGAVSRNLRSGGVPDSKCVGTSFGTETLSQVFLILYTSIGGDQFVLSSQVTSTQPMLLSHWHIFMSEPSAFLISVRYEAFG